MQVEGRYVDGVGDVMAERPNPSRLRSTSRAQGLRSAKSSYFGLSRD
jgi:hypothetical protein